MLKKRLLDGFIIRPWIIDLVRRLRVQGIYLGKDKRDASLFTDIAVMLALPSSALLFVDDNSDNVIQAQIAGLQTIHYVDKNSFLAEMEKLMEKSGFILLCTARI